MDCEKVTTTFPKHKYGKVQELETAFEITKFQHKIFVQVVLTAENHIPSELLSFFADFNPII